MDLVHRAQRVEYGIEHDFRHTHADEVVHDGGVQRGCLEIFEQLLLHYRHLVGHGVSVRAQVHGLGMRAAGEVEVARSVHIGANQRSSTVDTILGEVFIELLEVSVAVHRREHYLLVIEQMGAALEDAIELHLLQEHNPHVRLTGVFLRIVDIDRYEVSVVAILGDIGASLFTNLFNVRLPGIDEVNVLVREFLQQHTILDAHSTCTNHCVLHSHASLSLVFRMASFKR